jgi:hypothetical protein
MPNRTGKPLPAGPDPGGGHFLEDLGPQDIGQALPEIPEASPRRPGFAEVPVAHLGSSVLEAVSGQAFQGKGLFGGHGHLRCAPGRGAADRTGTGRRSLAGLILAEGLRKQQKIHQIAQHMADGDMHFLDAGGVAGGHHDGQIRGPGHRPPLAAA